MNDAEVTMFDDYWRTITRNEEFIQQWGHNLRTDWKDKWHQDLEDAYLRIRPLLGPVTRLRMFHRLPGDINPFEAENYHHALVLLLNPPEQWFENVGMLRSPEYLALKRGADVEGLSLVQANTAATTSDLTAIFDGLNETARNILEAMDIKVPRRWEEIGPLAGYSPDKVRQYSTKLQNAKFIKKTPRGFIRLFRLPGECVTE